MGFFEYLSSSGLHVQKMLGIDGMLSVLWVKKALGIDQKS